MRLLQNFLTNKSLLRNLPSILYQENGSRLKGITRLKGELNGNPALQGGERACRARPSGGRHSPERRRLGIVPMSRSWNADNEGISSGGAVFQTGCL